MSQHQLPSTMYDTDKWSTEAYIEYVLLVKAGSAKAVVPLYVRRPSVPSPITNYGMQLRSFSQKIRTLALRPEYAQGPAPLGTELKSMLRLSKTPKYSYSVMVA